MAKYKVECEEYVKKNKGSILWGLYKREWKKFLYKGGPPDEEEDVAKLPESDVKKTNQVDNVFNTTNNLKD